MPLITKIASCIRKLTHPDIFYMAFLKKFHIFFRIYFEIGIIIISKLRINQRCMSDRWWFASKLTFSISHNQCSIQVFNIPISFRNFTFSSPKWWFLETDLIFLYFSGFALFFSFFPASAEISVNTIRVLFVTVHHTISWCTKRQGINKQKDKQTVEQMWIF